MAGLFAVVVVVLVALMSASCGVVVGDAQGVHHLAGGGHGWDAATSDLQAWSSQRVFRVGDNIWFAYSSEKDNIVEIGSRMEFESCDIKNPIRMYTSGFDKVVLEDEGARFFVSSKVDNCRNGLKLHVNVMPHDRDKDENAMEMPSYFGSALAAGPQPSVSPPSIVVTAVASLWVWIGIAACFMAF